MSDEQRDAWRKALSARGRQLRNRRGRRPGPQISGVRIMPPESRTDADSSDDEDEPEDES